MVVQTGIRAKKRFNIVLLEHISFQQSAIFLLIFGEKLLKIEEFCDFPASLLVTWFPANAGLSSRHLTARGKL
jgi:hypothetical protein